MVDFHEEPDISLAVSGRAMEKKACINSEKYESDAKLPAMKGLRISHSEEV